MSANGWNDFPDYPTAEEVFSKKEKPVDVKTIRINEAREVIKRFVDASLKEEKESTVGALDQEEFDGEISLGLLENLQFAMSADGDTRQDKDGDVEIIPHSEYEAALEALYQWDILKWRPT